MKRYILMLKKIRFVNLLPTLYNYIKQRNIQYNLGGVNLKKSVLKLSLITLILSITLLCAGCGLIKGVSKATVANKSSENTVKSTVIIKSSDGAESIAVPTSWKEDAELNDAALLQVSNRVQEKYVMIIGEGKESFSKQFTLSDYTSATKKNMLQTAANSSATEAKDIVLNGYKAQYYELAGEVQQVKVTYLIINVETTDKFYQIIGWTLTPKFDANKAEIKSVMDSFKVIK